MAKATFTSLITLLLLSAATPASASYYSEALRQLAAGEQQEAQKLLESVPVHSNEFVPAMVELQKIYYRTQRWQNFFAYAYYYRNQLLSANSSAQFHPRPLALEVLALARHCRWKEALEIGTAAIQVARQLDHTRAEELEKALVYVNLHFEFPGIHKGKESLTRPALAFTDELLWELEPEQALQVDHPRDLRMIVESRCQS